MPNPDARRAAANRLLAAALWLATTFVAVKAYYLGRPDTLGLAEMAAFCGSLSAISYGDVFFALAAWTSAHALLSLRRGAVWGRVVSGVFVVFSTACAVYAVANVVMFGIFGGFLTYPLLALVGDVRMIRSSVAAHVTPGVIAGLIGVPLTYGLVVEITRRALSRLRAPYWTRHLAVVIVMVAWAGAGLYTYGVTWATRADRRIAENPHWLLASSWVRAVRGDGTVRMADRFEAADLTDFAPLGARAESPRRVLQSALRRAARAVGAKASAAERPPNVILIVLESVAARWVSLNSAVYETTPVLRAEASRGLVFDNVYAPIGRSSNSLAAMLLSAYPKLDFRDLTEEYPRLPGTSLASLFADRGYRTAFTTPSDLHWAGWDVFLKDRGFGAVTDYHDLACPDMLSSWGVEDRCMVDGMLRFVEAKDSRPFFVMGWTTQTHHPYEPTPGVPELDLVKEPTRDDYDLGRYLNVLHETDRQLGRLFDTLRRTGLDKNTIVVVTGDHGQAFGYPHDTYIQGRTVYEEDVHVPLMVWSPKRYRAPARSGVVGGLVDLSPTIAQLAGFSPAADWQGRSLFSEDRSNRAYFYVAEDHFTLGVREGAWKYIFALREGAEELYDLEHDPTEQHNLASAQPERAARLRQRLAAWTDANHRQYAAFDAARQ